MHAPEPDLHSVMQVRRNPSLHLSPGRTTDLRDIALELANDALYLGAPSVTVERFADWFLVTASIDWILQGTNRQVPEVFFRIQLFHLYRQNATRATILSVAFAQDVVTFLEGAATVVVGCAGCISELAAFVKARHPTNRVVAFKGIPP